MGADRKEGLQARFYFNATFLCLVIFSFGERENCSAKKKKKKIYHLNIMESHNQLHILLFLLF